jgi:hypothetical protein
MEFFYIRHIASNEHICMKIDDIEGKKRYYSYFALLFILDLVLNLLFVSFQRFRNKLEHFQ